MEIDIFLDIGKKVYESLKFVLFKQAHLWTYHKVDTYLNCQWTKF
jgi:hypothetical protein